MRLLSPHYNSHTLTRRKSVFQNGTRVHPEFVKIPPLCFCAPETRRMLLKLRGALCVLDQGHAPGEETNHLEGEFLNEAQNCGYTHAFCICVMGRGTDLDRIGAPTRRSG